MQRAAVNVCAPQPACNCDCTVIKKVTLLSNSELLELAHRNPCKWHGIWIRHPSLLADYRVPTKRAACWLSLCE
jgi:hypothetical protein